MQSTKHRTHARVKRKKGTKHPYHKWIAIRAEIAETAVESRALIKTIADFIKVILPDITLAQKVSAPKSESAELGTQTVKNLTKPPHFVALPSTSSDGDVYETETSTVSTRYGGANAVPYDDNYDMNTGAFTEECVHAFARKSFGEIASPTYHHMCTGAAFSTDSMVCVK